MGRLEATHHLHLATQQLFQEQLQLLEQQALLAWLEVLWQEVFSGARGRLRRQPWGWAHPRWVGWGPLGLWVE